MNLRDRIAAAASNHLSDHFICYLEDAQALHLADAVIAELGCEEVLQYLKVPQRFVTGWAPDDLWPVIDRLIEMAGPRCFAEKADK
jgi:hypothetical protein